VAVQIGVQDGGGHILIVGVAMLRVHSRA